MGCGISSFNHSLNRRKTTESSHAGDDRRYATTTRNRGKRRLMKNSSAERGEDKSHIVGSNDQNNRFHSVSSSFPPEGDIVTSNVNVKHNLQTSSSSASTFHVTRQRSKTESPPSMTTTERNMGPMRNSEGLSFHDVTAADHDHTYAHKKQDGKKTDANYIHDHDDDDCDKRVSSSDVNDIEGPLFIGSLSFREYVAVVGCDPNDDHKNDTHGNNGRNVRQDNTVRVESMTTSSTSKEYIPKSSIPATVVKNRWGTDQNPKRRSNGFKKVFPVHRPPAAVRNLMNVSSCYSRNNNLISSRPNNVAKLPAP